MSLCGLFWKCGFSGTRTSPAKRTGRPVRKAILSGSPPKSSRMTRCRALVLLRSALPSIGRFFACSSSSACGPIEPGAKLLNIRRIEAQPEFASEHPNSMSTTIDHFMREQLLDRSERLRHAEGGDHSGRLGVLLEEVDSALARFEDGSYGICEYCHEPIESDRLVADPLV